MFLAVINNSSPYQPTIILPTIHYVVNIDHLVPPHQLCYPGSNLVHPV